MTNITANYKLKLTQFNRRGWQDEYYVNMRIVDSALSTIMTVAQFVGVWENQQAYTIGQKVTDGDNSIIYECLVNHTSSASPTTFFEERTANPTYWTAWSLPARSRGAWVAGTAYAMGDFVSDASSGKYAVCIVSHTASSNFLTDISAGYWDVLATITPVTLSNVAPQAVGSVASAGVGGLAARDDHVHALAATLTTTEGVQGGGNVIANLTIKLDVNNLTTDTAPALTDPIAYYKVASTAHRKMSLQSLWNTVNSLTAYTTLNIADEIPVRDGSGGGNGVRKITVQNFFNGINVLTALTAPAAADTLVTYDSAGSAAKKITFANLLKVVNLLTALTTPATTDLLPVYDGAGAAGKAISYANLLKIINSLTEDTTPDGVNDYLATYDASAAASKKASLFNVIKAAFKHTTLTASSSAKISTGMVDTTNYCAYLCFLDQLKPATNGDTLWIRASTDAGSTLNSTAVYSNATWAWNSAPESAATGTVGDTKIVLSGAILNTGRGVSGLVLLIQDGTAAFDWNVIAITFGDPDTPGGNINCVITMGEANLASVNGFGFQYSTGNIASGNARILAIPK